MRQGASLLDLVGNLRVCEQADGLADALWIVMELVSGHDLRRQFLGRVKDKQLRIADDPEVLRCQRSEADLGESRVGQ